MQPTSRATIEDVAALAGVSIKTVSRVVNNEPNVRANTRERVQQAVSELKYTPNVSARNLASHRSHLIVLVYDDPSSDEIPSSGFAIKMQEGALSACKRGGYELLIHPSNYRDEDFADKLNNIVVQLRPAGIVLAAPLSTDKRIVQAVRETGVPFVRLSTGEKTTRREYVVGTNDREVSAEMVAYLASLGHTDIAFIAGHASFKDISNRLSGYRDGLEKAGLRVTDALVAQGDNSLESGEEAATRLLKRKKRPTAIFAATDTMAAGALRAAYKLGIRVPEDLSVAGCDDFSIAQLTYPTMTTIRQPVSLITEKATSALIGASESNPLKACVDTEPATLIVRESTGPAPTT